MSYRYIRTDKADPRERAEFPRDTMVEALGRAYTDGEILVDQAERSASALDLNNGGISAPITTTFAYWHVEYRA